MPAENLLFMRIIPVGSSSDLKRFKNPVVALGVFDGVHRGHQKLIAKTIQRSAQLKGTSAVLTFFPHPVQVLNKKFNLSLLMSLSHRLCIIERLGIDVCFVVHFTRSFAHLTAEQFIQKYLKDGLGAKEILIGANFHFGKNRGGNRRALQKLTKKYSIRANILPSVCYHHHVISSSRLRALVKRGNLKLAKKYLGRDVSALGEIVHGDHRGLRLGFPTANINTGREIVLPNGVYVVRAILSGRIFDGVANIGHRPSFEKKSNKVIEVHLFKFHQNIYGKTMEVQFLKKLRNEENFSRPEDLCAQVEKDKLRALRYFSRPRHR